MAQLTDAGSKFYKPHFGIVSWVFVFATTLPLDLVKFLIDFVPGVDLINWPISVFTFFAINLFFLIKLGLGYLGGKKSGQKVFITIATAIVSAIPLLDGFVPDETIDAAGIMWATTQEDIETANDNAETAIKTTQQEEQRAYDYAVYMQQRQQAANDNAQQASEAA
jgi:hypothetical protein